MHAPRRSIAQPTCVRVERRRAREYHGDMKSPRAEQPLAVRITHWANVPLLAVMAASGLQILAAFPQMGPKGGPAGWYPLQDWTPPSWMRAGEWLAGARHLHFGLAW